MKLLLIILLAISAWSAAASENYHRTSLKDLATGKARYSAVRVRGFVAGLRMEGSSNQAFTIKLCESRERKYCVDIRYTRRMTLPAIGDYVEVTAERHQ